MVVYQVQEMAAHYGIVPGICLLGTSSRWATTMTICTLCVEIDATYSDPPIRPSILPTRGGEPSTVTSYRRGSHEKNRVATNNPTTIHAAITNRWAHWKPIPVSKGLKDV